MDLTPSMIGKNMDINIQPKKRKCKTSAFNFVCFNSSLVPICIMRIWRLDVEMLRTEGGDQLRPNLKSTWLDQLIGFKIIVQILARTRFQFWQGRAFTWTLHHHPPVTQCHPNFFSSLVLSCQLRTLSLVWEWFYFLSFFVFPSYLRLLQIRGNIRLQICNIWADTYM